MDITLARTFLAIVEVGNFAKAAEQLYVTQSTVSARIKLLEDLLGQTLFVRTKTGARLTPAGAQFKRFAERMIQTWEHARKEVGLPQHFTGSVTLGVEFGQWERLLPQWMSRMRDAAPGLAIRVEVGTPAGLMRQLSEGLLDLAVTGEPQQRAGFATELLLEDDIVLAATRPDEAKVGEAGYIYVDWGPDFRTFHGNAFPDCAAPVISVSHAMLAIFHLIDNGGSAYLPRRLLRTQRDGARFHVVGGAPVFKRPVHIVFAARDEPEERLLLTIESLREVAKIDDEY